MSTAGGLYSLLFVPKPQPPPYNPISKLVMKVETETVQIRNVSGGATLEPERNYPHYPVLERKLEIVAGDGAVLTSESATTKPKTLGGAYWYSSSSDASSSASSDVGDEDDIPSWQWQPKSGRQSKSPSSSRASGKSPSWRWRSKPNRQPESPSFSSSAEAPASPYQRSGSISSFSSLGSFSYGPESPSRPGSETEARIVGVVKSNAGKKMKLFKGDGVVVKEHLDATSPESWPGPVRKRAEEGRNVGVVYAPGPAYAGWTMKKNKFTRRKQVRPNYRAIHLAELEEKKRQDGSTAV